MMAIPGTGWFPDTGISLTELDQLGTLMIVLDLYSSQAATWVKGCCYDGSHSSENNMEQPLPIGPSSEDTHRVKNPAVSYLRYFASK
jgi:hypothetical protein